MINLKEIIVSLGAEKQQELILYLEKKNKRQDAKNIELVNLLITRNISSSEICETLYKKDNKPALHALRKRLFQSIIDFTANVSLKEENSVDMHLIKFIIAARSFFEKEQITLGYQILNKAEVIAKEHQLFTILNEIYHSKIQYSHANNNLVMEDLIIQFEENQRKLILEETLNIVYAKIRKALNEFQHNKSKIEIKTIIDRSLSDHGFIEYHDLSLKSLYQILQIINLSSFQKFDYWNIESFALEIYEVVINNKSKDKQLYYHIEIVYLIANILFRNKKFKESLEFLKLMESLMNENKQKFHSYFSPKHHLLLSLNYNYSQRQDEAIQLLKRAVERKKIDLIMQLDMYLSLIVFYYQNGLLNEAKGVFAKFYHTDQWYIKKAGIIWTIKKSLIEILLHIDLGNINLVDSRLKSFKKNYFKHLKEINQERVITYLKLIETYYKNPEIVTNNSFKEKVENAFKWIDNDKEDIFMMSFFAWLKAKMSKQDVYEVTMNLIHYSEDF